MSDFDVVIIGAGAAGLAALHVLDKAGLRVVLLEARDRIGGRIHTIHDPLCSLPLELGAEFIHGRPKEIWDIIHDAGLAVYDGTDDSRYMNDGVVERNADAWLLVHSALEDMRQAAQDGDKSFEEFLAGTSYSEETRRSTRGFIEGFNAADSKIISIQALAEEMTAAQEIDGDRSFRFSTGYDATPLHILRSVPNWQAKLRVNQVVERIEWQAGSVAIRTNRGKWTAQQAIITVPLGVLQERSIVFSPEPSSILKAAQALEFGHVYRVVLRFREAFWESRDELKDVGFLLSHEQFFPTWWTTLARRSTLLTGWSAGAHATGLEHMNREEVLDTALQSLARVTGFPLTTVRDRLECMYFHDWFHDEYSRGAYSYVPAGALWARKQIAEPVEETLFFAGEATDQSGHSATVHGAIASGRRAAQQVLSGRR